MTLVVWSLNLKFTSPTWRPGRVEGLDEVTDLLFFFIPETEVQLVRRAWIGEVPNVFFPLHNVVTGIKLRYFENTHIFRYMVHNSCPPISGNFEIFGLLKNQRPIGRFSLAPAESWVTVLWSFGFVDLCIWPWVKIVRHGVQTKF